MWENGSTGKLMVMESIPGLMEIVMKENGKSASSRGKVLTFLEMETNTQANIKRVNLMGLDFIFGLTVVIMKEISKMD